MKKSDKTSSDKPDNQTISRRSFFKLSAIGGAIGLSSSGSLANAVTNKKSLLQRNSLSNTYEELEKIKSDADAQGVSHFDVVVIGSGYGGAIMAARLAGGNRRLAILERGREWLPGKFPETLADAAANVRYNKNPLGLLDFQINKEIDVLVGSGLGGTSLINANIVIEPDKEVFEQSQWPKSLRDDVSSGKMEKYYSIAREMLRAQFYPSDWSPLEKTKALQNSTMTVGDGGEGITPKMAVNYVVDGTNPDGVQQVPCSLCGNCVTGCNVGAKNTLDTNYLPFAKNKGANIFSQMEVRYFARVQKGRYTIYYDYHLEDGTSIFGSLTAKNVIVSAGSLGTSKILLKSQKVYNLPMSSLLGKRFSANGDFLGMCFDGRDKTNVMGFGTHESDYKVGPTITEIASYHKPQLLDRYIIEDGAIPSAVVEVMLRISPFIAFPKSLRKFWKALFEVQQKPEDRSLNRSMIFLGIGHDDSGGTFYLDKNWSLKLSWPDVNKQKVFKSLKEKMIAHSTARGGQFVQPDPRSSSAFGEHLMTVHPLGGCPMGESSVTGVVDDKGRVFNPESGGVHQGLYVMDGSIIPTALGVNPLLTISALAERAAENIEAELNSN